MSVNIDKAAPVTQPANAVIATVVSGGTEGAIATDAGYCMLESTELTTEGGFVGGRLFFELGEEFTLQFAREGTDALRVRARVVEIERGDEPGMWIEFVGVDTAQSKRLAELVDSK